VAAGDIRRVFIRRLRVLASLVMVVLLGVLALYAQPAILAQEATPAGVAGKGGAESRESEGVERSVCVWTYDGMAGFSSVLM
jgi:hypothetical protein